MAMEVEDHPVEYADFEGIIPEGNYGAGEVIVWDKGVWVPLEDPALTFPRGKLTFELRGYKLRGAWHLFRTKGKGREAGKEWMLVKRADAYAGAGKPLGPESIYSGLTLEELREGTRRAEEVRAELVELKALRKAVRAKDVSVTLAETRDRPWSAPGWIFELKYDGYRLLVARDGDQARLLLRRGSTATDTFPEIARAVAALPFRRFLLDGEVVVLDEQGRPSFAALQKRGRLQSRADALRAAVERPATFYGFDLLAFGEFDLRPLPLRERKTLLARLLPRLGPLRFADHVEEQGEALYAEVERRRLEGILAKRADSAYRAGRSRDWLKLRLDRTGDFVIVGMSAPTGARAGFGALHLAAWRGGTLAYVGRVGSGFDEDLLTALRGNLEAARQPSPAFAGLRPGTRGDVWVAPERVCEVRFKEWTPDGLLRQPVFLRLREDKRPDECVIEDDAAREPPAPELAIPRPPDGSERKVTFTNLDKVFWPEEGYTKGDLIEFYRTVSPWLLPYLADRPVVLTRYPDGIAAKSFFQKDAPAFAPGWVRTERMWSEHAQRETDAFVCDDVETLLFLANLGAIPLHVWSSRIRTLQQPDWCILDFDPKGASFQDVIRLALDARELCDEIGLPCYPKTSGASGMHVLIPLGRQVTYEQSRTLAELLARVLCQRRPELATVARPLAARGGRVYLDFGQNGHGRLLAAPYGVRPLPGATVSTPLRWSEVKEGLDPRRFTIRSLPRRLRALAEDPLLPVLDQKPDLGAALARLEGKIRS
jgi:bifunctional non-homologous end joining protein LigD